MGSPIFNDRIASPEYNEKHGLEAFYPETKEVSM
jgi:hypothetical protein